MCVYFSKGERSGLRDHVVFTLRVTELTHLCGSVGLQALGVSTLPSCPFHQNKVRLQRFGEIVLSSLERAAPITTGRPISKRRNSLPGPMKPMGSFRHLVARREGDSSRRPRGVRSGRDAPLRRLLPELHVACQLAP